MKRIDLLILVMVGSMTTIWAQSFDNLADCETYRTMINNIPFMPDLPGHFCECSVSEKFSFPLDTKLTGTVWYNATLGAVKQGITAYLYADCEVKIDILLTCALSYAAYSYTLSPNQTRDISADAIENKLASAGVEGINDDTPVYLKIYPMGGTVQRVICLPYNQGFHSTCSDCLGIFPNMTVVSSHADDVFHLDAAYIPADKGLAVYWDEPNISLCRLKITRGVCDGVEMAEAELMSADQPYYIDNNLLNEARVSGDGLYLHFSHDASAVGRIRIKEYENAPTALSNVQAESAAQIIIDRNGMMYIRRGNERYTVLGNKL